MGQRLIDADALKKSFDEHVYLVHHGFNETEYGCTQYGIHQIIDEQPTIDAEPVRHGKWEIEISDYGHQATYRCSECGHQFKWIYNPYFPPVFNYCQKCGARMDKE